MTVSIEQLRYIHLGSRDPEAAAHFAVERLGMEIVSSQGDQWHLRSDHRAVSLIFSPLRTQAVGLQVRDVSTLDTIAERLAEHGIASRRDDALAQRRLAQALLAFATSGGTEIELIVRPRDNGWRFFPTRKIGLLGLTGVTLRCADVNEDETLLRDVLGLDTRDWIGDAAYLGFDRAHHRIALHPSTQAGVLAVDFQLDCLDQLMQAWYRLQASGETAAHGPGRRPVSDQAFLSFDGPDDVYFNVVAEGHTMTGAERPRQFAPEPASYCSWGSECRIAEYGAQVPARGRPQLREIGS